ncbi:MAG TPA: HEAT repeat domain-containing protein [Gemmataceae bacterium]|nr:HEAT repeat domain-containing protein [Gemmataceae bacterium]
MRHLARCITGTMALAIASSFNVPASVAEESAGQVVIIRESGKLDKRCVVEKSIPQPNGTILHEVRNLATGERYRVIDHRSPKTTSQRTIVSRPQDKTRTPTPAELAVSSSPPSSRTISEHDGWLKGTTKTVAAPPSVPSIPNVISAASSNWPANEETEASATKHIQLLRTSPDAALRETAALALAASESRKKTEVIDALASGAKSDPTATVRICCLRCLWQLGKNLPQVIPTIQELQADADEKIQQIAHNAMQELAPQAVQRSQH